ncbi:DoxX family protein [Rhodococcus triatomae]|uniref:DoxX-like family protein n=1 Tax=Rhodococcus triatomae TaxID=300028 RepID=A0A1G8H6A0_9NOCA|nr:DoxX family protein [Rhodococcus triatomae]QNG20196.1 DoxX family protein [Rhodococcus triatomae]QNG23889.1 DoxX family protein [Rhodococcus triatomae]SDI02079.1 DoxX-like family protein [Rhodococcus triatomae]
MNTSTASTSPAAAAAPISARARIAGWILTGLAGLFLLFDVIVHLVHPESATEWADDRGLPYYMLTTMGVLLGISLVLYLIPRTAVLGAVLITAYLGGAVWENIRSEEALFGYILFPVYIAIVVWLGLYLRDARARAVAPW